ncbi:DUF1059 domain-containing protein [Nocardioides marmoraquaticus]
MTFTLVCGDVMPGCTATFDNADRGALLADVASHAAADHGVTELTPDVLAVVDRSVVEVG